MTADGSNTMARLTRVQWLYLEHVDSHGRLEKGHGGMRSTITVRLLEQAGMVSVRWGLDTDWTIEALTRQGRAELAARRASQ